MEGVGKLEMEVAKDRGWVRGFLTCFIIFFLPSFYYKHLEFKTKYSLLDEASS